MTSTPVLPLPPLPGAGDSAMAAALPDMGVLVFEGPDAAAFLHGQLSTDVRGMAPGEAAWSSYNSPKGRMLGSPFLWRRAEGAFAAWVPADLAEAMRRRLAMFVLRSKVTITDRSSAGRCFGLAGATAPAALRAALSAAPDPGQGIEVEGCAVAATPDGRFFVDAPLESAEAIAGRLFAHCREIPADHWNWLGIQAGVPVITSATADLFVPQMVNWDLVGGVNFHKGCYPGQEIIARMQYLGRLKERLHAFHAPGAPPAPATPIYSSVFGEQSCGTVVNAASAPAGGCDLLAVLQWAAHDAGELHLGAPGGPLLSPRSLPYEVPPPASPNRPKL
jgi:folate-binding protein YgfZ